MMLANDCHLTRSTDDLLLSSAVRGKPTGGLTGTGTGGLFADLERFEYLDQPSRWLISRQICGVLKK